jgi:hypothetical protein
VAGGAAEIDQPAEPAQIERSDHGRRAELSLPVHAHQELAQVRLVAEEVRKDRSVKTVCLLPAVRALAHRVVEVCPELPQYGVGIAGVAG